MTEPQDQGERRIVVGIDGSAQSKAALAWAIQQARLTDAVIDAVIAWEPPDTYGCPLRINVDSTFEECAADALTNAIQEASGEGGRVKTRPKVLRGHAARVLLDESAGADLLVIGSRGHGGFAEALLGSVGQHCVHHATCPVVVIRDSITGRS